MATISWFIKSESSFVRVEEELFSFDEKTLTFTRDGIKYQLTSEHSLPLFLCGDVLFMRQGEGGKLIPFALPETLSREEVNLVGGQTPSIQPGYLKDLIGQRTEKLKKYLMDYQDVIKFLVKQNAEKDLLSLDFLKDLQSFKDNFYGEFLKILEQNIDEIVQKKRIIAPKKTPSSETSAPVEKALEGSTPLTQIQTPEMATTAASQPTAPSSTPPAVTLSSPTTPLVNTPSTPQARLQPFMGLRQLLADTLTLKREIETGFNASGRVQGNISYEALRFVFKITPPIKPAALQTAQKYFQVKDGAIIIEGDGVPGLARIVSNIEKWLADLKEFAEVHPE